MRTLALALFICTLAAAPQIFPPWPAIWSSFDSRPKDCHRGLVDASGRLILVGVETFGDLRTVAARQAVTMLVNEKGFWSEPIRISEPGIVYFSDFAVDGTGRVWVVWSEFKANRWSVMARSWDRGKLGVAAEVSSPASTVNLQPAVAAVASGEIYVAWESADKGRFCIEGRGLREGRWSTPEILSQ